LLLNGLDTLDDMNQPNAFSFSTKRHDTYFLSQGRATNRAFGGAVPGGYVCFELISDDPETGASVPLGLQSNKPRVRGEPRSIREFTRRSLQPLLWHSEEKIAAARLLMSSRTDERESGMKSNEKRLRKTFVGGSIASLGPRV